MSEKKTKRVELRAYLNVIVEFDAAMVAKMKALDAAIKESESIGFDMLSLKGALGGINFARRDLLDRLHALDDVAANEAKAAVEIITEDDHE